MYHVLKSSVSLQLLSDMFGSICFYVNVYVFWLGEVEPTKKLSLTFQIPKMKAVHSSQRALYVFLKEQMCSGRCSFCRHQDLCRFHLLHPHEYGGGKGTAGMSQPRSNSHRTAAATVQVGTDGNG